MIGWTARDAIRSRGQSRVVSALALLLAACGQVEAGGSAGEAEPGEAASNVRETCESNPNLAGCGPDVQLLQVPGGLTSCLVTGATTHGSSIVGGCSNTEVSLTRSVRWQRDGAGEILDLEGSSQASAISADGTITVGGLGLPSEEGYRYGPALRERLAVALTDVSDDGSTVVGAGFGEQSNWDTVYAVGGHAGQELERLTPLAEGLPAMVYAVSGDGRRSVGFVGDAAGRNHAAYWTEGGALQLLPEFPGAIHSYATSVNSDGSVIVGTVSMDEELDVTYAVRWTGAAVERLSDDTASGIGVSADGRRILIQYGFPDVAEAIWEDGEARTIRDGFSPRDFGRPESELLTRNFQVWGLTPDGGAVFGVSYTLDGASRVFIARLPE